MRSGNLPSDGNVQPAPTTAARAGDASASRSVAIVWRDDVEGGEVELKYAVLNSLDGKTAKSPGDFRLEPGVRRLQIHIDESHTDPGAYATRVTVRFRVRNFSTRDGPRRFYVLPPRRCAENAHSHSRVERRGRARRAILERMTRSKPQSRQRDCIRWRT